MRYQNCMTPKNTFIKVFKIFYLKYKNPAFFYHVLTKKRLTSTTQHFIFKTTKSIARNEMKYLVNEDEIKTKSLKYTFSLCLNIQCRALDKTYGNIYQMGRERHAGFTYEDHLFVSQVAHCLGTRVAGLDVLYLDLPASQHSRF